LGNAVGIALVALVFFNVMGGQATRSTAALAPQLRHQLVTEAQVTPQEADRILAGFTRCAEDRSKESDPEAVPASCRPDPAHPATAEVQRILADAGTEAAGQTFSRSFQSALWYVIGVMALAFLLMFNMPRKPRHLDPDAAFADEDEDWPTAEPATQPAAGPAEGPAPDPPLSPQSPPGR
jgi:hypothetical protein